eukprot:Sspe_Gene.88036::Locus_60171_Transcript_1_1_Confidence_1.000_Length_3408::g.88036::m.88036
MANTWPRSSGKRLFWLQHHRTLPFSTCAPWPSAAIRTAFRTTRSTSLPRSPFASASSRSLSYVAMVLRYPSPRGQPVNKPAIRFVKLFCSGRILSRTYSMPCFCVFSFRSRASYPSKHFSRSTTTLPSAVLLSDTATLMSSDGLHDATPSIIPRSAPYASFCANSRPPPISCSHSSATTIPRTSFRSAAPFPSLSTSCTNFITLFRSSSARPLAPTSTAFTTFPKLSSIPCAAFASRTSVAAPLDGRSVAFSNALAPRSHTRCTCSCSLPFADFRSSATCSSTKFSTSFAAPAARSPASTPSKNSSRFFSCRVVSSFQISTPCSS